MATGKIVKSAIPRLTKELNKLAKERAATTDPKKKAKINKEMDNLSNQRKAARDLEKSRAAVAKEKALSPADRRARKQAARKRVQDARAKENARKAAPKTAPKSSRPQKAKAKAATQPKKPTVPVAKKTRVAAKKRIAAGVAATAAAGAVVSNRQEGKKVDRRGRPIKAKPKTAPKVTKPVAKKPTYKATTKRATMTNRGSSTGAKPKKKGLSGFEKAFAAARKAGRTVFSFGGESYNTKRKDGKSLGGRMERAIKSGPKNDKRPQTTRGPEKGTSAYRKKYGTSFWRNREQTKAYNAMKKKKGRK